MKSPRIPQSSFNDCWDNPRSWSSSSSQLSLTTWRLQNSYSFFNNKCFPIEQGEETILRFGFWSFFLEEKKNTTNPNNKVPRRIPQLVSNAVACCCGDDADGALHIFTTQSKTLKTLKTHGWTHVQSDVAHGALHIFTAQSKTLKVAEDSWLNSCSIWWCSWSSSHLHSSV